jgi:hypothetical protein
MSQSAVATAQAKIKDFADWISFDEDPVESIPHYGSITEMKMAPLALNAETEELFLAAKRQRAPRVAKPLSLD